MTPLENAKSYVEKHGKALGLPAFRETPSTLVKDEALGARVGKLYERLPHAPEHPKVKASYDALKKEIRDQYLHLQAAGVKMVPWKQEGQPYQNSQEMRHDVLTNTRLHYFPTNSGFGQGEDTSGHPMLEQTGLTEQGHPLVYNDLFRAVHDYFGHAVHGHQFGPQGEMRAWEEHARMFSPAARPALTMETHGQNSWVNFGPHNPQSRPVQERPYAEQKANVMPPKVYPVKLAAPKTNRIPLHSFQEYGRLEGNMYGLLKAVLENPTDTTPKHILADYLEEQGEEKYGKTIQHLRGASATGFADTPLHIHLPKKMRSAEDIIADRPAEIYQGEDYNHTTVQHPVFLGHEYTKALQRKETAQEAERQLLEHLDNTSDPRAEIVRGKMGIHEAHEKALGTDPVDQNTPVSAKFRRGILTQRGFHLPPGLEGDARVLRGRVSYRQAHLRDTSYQPVTHDFRDGTKLAVNVHADLKNHANQSKPEPDYDPKTRLFHVMWTGFGPRNGYHTVMTPEAFHGMIDKLPHEPGRAHPSVTFQNNKHTYLNQEETREQPHKLARQDGTASALGNSMSLNADKRKEVAESILREAGLSPSAVRTVLAHEQGRGTRSSVVAAITAELDPGLSKYVASWLGLLSQEHALTVFHANEGGRDKLHVLHTNMQADELGDRLRNGGVPNFSVEQQPNGSRAYVYSHNGTYDLHIQKALGGTGARAAIFSGTGFKLGSDSGSDAKSRAKYRDAISTYENGGTGGGSGSTDKPEQAPA